MFIFPHNSPTLSMKKQVLTLLLTFGASQISMGQVDLTKGLVAYYPFDGNAKDHSGNGYDLTVTGAVLTTDRDSAAGKAYAFNGISNKMDGTGLNFGGSKTLSISAWFKTSPTGLAFFLAGNGASFAAFTEDGPYAGLAISVPATNSAVGKIVAGKWNHLAGLYDGDSIKVYINGQAAGTTFHHGSNIYGSTPLTVGYYSSSFWSGSLDDIYLYNRLLSLDEIKTLYEGTNLVTGGLAQEDANRSMTISPNPVNRSFWMDKSEGTEVSSLSISDMLGQTVKTFQVSGEAQWNVEELPRGTYFVKAQVGDRIFSSKIIKE